MSQFPLFAASVPLLGRDRILQRLIGDLTKPTPSHLSLVAPRSFGKTVLLEKLATEMQNRGAFQCVLEWDLGHQTPQTDGEFLDALRRIVAEGLKDSHRDLYDHLTEPEAGYDELREVIDALGTEKKAVLMLWDCLDHPLRSGKLTRNLWDNLLELCRMKGFVLVTATRKKLQELIRDGKSITSDFWQVFEVVPMGPMDETDVRAFTAVMPGLSFQSGAMAELINWSGGIPALVVCLLNRIGEEIGQGEVSNAAVNSVASQPGEKTAGIVESLWGDVTAPAADLFHLLIENSEMQASRTPKAERMLLVEMGLARVVAGKLTPACRFLEVHAAESAESSGLLARLFDPWENYRTNIRGILERRISHLSKFDADLFRMVERGIDDIPGHPEICLNNLTHIEERALDLIWERELGRDREFSQEVRSYWAEYPRSKNTNVSRMMTVDRWVVQGERSDQRALLQLYTGSHQDFPKAMARYTCKDTYVLVDAIHRFRNRSQHSGGQQIHLGVAVAAIMLCIELLGCLERAAPNTD